MTIDVVLTHDRNLCMRLISPSVFCTYLNQQILICASHVIFMRDRFYSELTLKKKVFVKKSGKFTIDQKITKDPKKHYFWHVLCNRAKLWCLCLMYENSNNIPKVGN